MLSRTIAAIFPDTPRMRTLMAIVVLAGIGCGIAGAEPAAKAVSPIADPVPLPRPRPKMGLLPSWIATLWREPQTFREAAGDDFKTSEVTSEPSACRMRLEKFAVVAAMPRLIGPGSCGGGDIVRLDAVLVGGGGKPSEVKRIDIKPAPYLQCPMAEQLALWVRDDAAPQTAAAGPLRSVETYDDFNCRGRNRKMFGKVSEHGKANAVDIRGLTFQDGRFVNLTDVKAAKDMRDNLRKSTCLRFTTVLGPGSDGYHEEHIHLDLAERRNGYRLCQWDVREPPPPKAPEKPAEKPEAEVAAAPADGTPAEAEPADDAAAVAAPSPPVQFAGGVVPLPKPRPPIRAGRRKVRDYLHLPFNLLR